MLLEAWFNYYSEGLVQTFSLACLGDWLVKIEDLRLPFNAGPRVQHGNLGLVHFSHVRSISKFSIIAECLGKSSVSVRYCNRKLGIFKWSKTEANLAKEDFLNLTIFQLPVEVCRKSFSVAFSGLDSKSCHILASILNTQSIRLTAANIWIALRLTLLQIDLPSF